MNKHCFYILCSRYDLLEYQIKSFYYKNKIDTDLFIVVDEKEDVKVENFQDIIREHSNPNFKPENVLNLRDIDLKVSEILDLSEKGKQCILKYAMSGMNTPVVYFNDLGYESIGVFEDDMLFTGPFDEMIKSGKEFSGNSWSTKTYPRFDPKSVPKFYGGQQNEVYEAIGIDKARWDSLKVEYKNFITRNPLIAGPVFTNELKGLLKKYLENDFIQNCWNGDAYSDKSRNGIKYSFFHHNDVITQYAMYLAWEKDFNVLGRYPKTQKVLSKSDNLKLDNVVKNAMKGYIIHYACGKIKKEMLEKTMDILDDLGYNGEFTKKDCSTPHFYTCRKFKVESHLYLKKSLQRGLDPKWYDIYAEGSWLNPNARHDELMGTKSGQKILERELKDVS